MPSLYSNPNWLLKEYGTKTLAVHPSCFHESNRIAIFAYIRFCRPDLMFWIVFIHAAMMTKALPWDRYVLPLAVAFWYLKSRFPGLVTPPIQVSDKSSV